MSRAENCSKVKYNAVVVLSRKITLDHKDIHDTLIVEPNKMTGKEHDMDYSSAVQRTFDQEKKIPVLLSRLIDQCDECKGCFHNPRTY